MCDFVLHELLGDGIDVRVQVVRVIKITHTHQLPM